MRKPSSYHQRCRSAVTKTCSGPRQPSPAIATFAPSASVLPANMRLFSMAPATRRWQHTSAGTLQELAASYLPERCQRTADQAHSQRLSAMKISFINAVANICLVRITKPPSLDPARPHQRFILLRYAAFTPRRFQFRATRKHLLNGCSIIYNSDDCNGGLYTWIRKLLSRNLKLNEIVWIKQSRLYSARLLPVDGVETGGKAAGEAGVIFQQQHAGESPSLRKEDGRRPRLQGGTVCSNAWRVELLNKMGALIIHRLLNYGFFSHQCPADVAEFIEIEQRSPACEIIEKPLVIKIFDAESQVRKNSALRYS